MDKLNRPKIFVFDIDGTICSKTDGDYQNAIPYTDRIFTINKLYNSGNTIYFQTARGMNRCSLDTIKAYSELYKFTETQLNSWGVKYHRLFMGKPPADFYVDDKSLSDKSFFDFL